MNNNKLSKTVNEIKKSNSFFSPIRKSQYVLEIDLGKGKSENLNIYPSSNPEELAYNFCLKHNLNFKTVKDLINKIKKLKENYSLSNKENICLTSNIINKKALNSKNYFIIKSKNKINKSKITNSINTFNYFSNKTVNEISKISKNNESKENKEIKENKNKENKTIINNFINSNSITPINYDSLYSNNNLDCTSDKNLNIFNFLSPTAYDNNKEKISNNNSNIIKTNNELYNKSEYNKKDNNDNCPNSSNNSITCNFNDSINDKIINLEKAYASFNPDNKKTENENNYNENIENTKEVISKAIQNCLNIVENEELIDNNNLTISESNNDSNEKKIQKSKNKTISVDVKNPDNLQNNIIFNNSEKSFKINNNSYITPEKNSILIQNDKNIIINKEDDDKKIKNISLDSKNNNLNNEINDDNKKEINDTFFENNEEKNQLENKEVAFNSSIKNNIIKVPQRKSNRSNFNKNENILKNNENNNMNKGNIDDNNIIQTQINFSLLSNKNNMTISYSHKENSNKRSFKKILPKNSAFCRSYREKGKNLEIMGNSNSIKENLNNLNSNSFNNNMNKDSLVRENHLANNIKRIQNISSIKTIVVNDNEKNIYSPLKINKSFNKGCLLSFTRSEKNMINLMSKNNNNRATTSSLGNFTNNNSTITKGSTNAKFCSHKNLINYNTLNKTSINHTFNLSNEFIFKKLKEKENSYYNNTINNSNSLYYKKYIKNSKKNFRSNYNIKFRKNRKLPFSSCLIINNSTLSNHSNINDNSPDYLRSKSNSNLNDGYKQFYNYQKEKVINNYCKNKLNKNNLARNLMNKNEIMNSLKNIFNYITKNKMILDVFGVVNIQNIPEEIYGIVKNIVKNCNQKKRFIEYNEFIDKAYYLFDKFTNEEKIIILNFNKINK